MLYWNRELSYWIKELSNWIKDLSNWIKDISIYIESSLNIWVSVNLAFHTSSRFCAFRVRQITKIAAPIFDGTGQEASSKRSVSLCFWADRIIKMATRSLIGWEIFDFISETAECKFAKIDRKTLLITQLPLPSLCFSGRLTNKV